MYHSRKSDSRGCKMGIFGFNEDTSFEIGGKNP
jgi:hypothetical protein